jgi:hypothetical protein
MIMTTPTGGYGQAPQARRDKINEQQRVSAAMDRAYAAEEQRQAGGAHGGADGDVLPDMPGPLRLPKGRPVEWAGE